MFWFLVFLVVVGVVAYKYRAMLLAKILGQPQSRVERRLNQRKQ